MTLPVPNLDDRQFTALVERERVQIPRYAPEWTDHNVHDPGITLLELFAWLAEMQIYYLNRVPAKHELKFLRLLGFTPRPASPATTYVTFTPSNSMEILPIPAGTKVAAPGIGTNERIVFETDVPLRVVPITLAQVITSDRMGVRDNTQANDQEGLFYFAFGEGTEQGSTLYLGLEFLTSPPGELFFASPPERPHLVLMVSLYEKDLPARGTHGDEGIQKAKMSLTQSGQDGEELQFFPSAGIVWEYWNGRQWVETWQDGTPLLQEDTTCAFSWSGNVTFNLPPDLAGRKIPPLETPAGTDLYWLRCKVVQAGYEIPPRFESIRLNTIPATQGFTIEGEILGASDQLPNQVFELAKAPLLAGTPRVTVREGDRRYREWQGVPDFDASGPDDEHYVLDRVNGAVLFGDGLNGRIPPAVKDIDGNLVNNIKVVKYRYGGGTRGNVSAEAIEIIVDDRLRETGVRVTNKEPAVGGAEEESLPDTWRRAAVDLRTPYQAVTSPDYEFLARATPQLRVARAKALPLLEPPNFTRRQGLVTVAVVPFGFSPKPMPSAGFLRTVCEHLDQHRLITTEVRVVPPDYVEVSVAATVLLKPRTSMQVARNAIETALNKFLHPLTGGVGGGVGGAGWEFGRSVYQSEIYQVIEGVNGVDCVMRVALAAQGNFQFDGNNIKLTRPHGLVYSGEHRLELIDPAQQCEIKGPCHEPNKRS
jgi:predicted phage baseplate assembly protein